MSWENIATTVAVLSVGGVLAFGGYTLLPNEDYLRIDRTCHPIHIVRDFAIDRSDVKSVGVENANKYVKLMDYLYNDVCVPKMGKYVYLESDSNMTLAMNDFRTQLINEGLSKEEINFIIEKGVVVRVNWLDKIDVERFYGEYRQFKELQKSEKVS